MASVVAELYSTTSTFAEIILYGKHVGDLSQCINRARFRLHAWSPGLRLMTCIFEIEILATPKKVFADQGALHRSTAWGSELEIHLHKKTKESKVSDRLLPIGATEIKETWCYIDIVCEWISIKDF